MYFQKVCLDVTRTLTHTSGQINWPGEENGAMWLDKTVQAGT